ncbi:hypothetical protein LA345_39985 (plasmid) [Burkholderia vietnamiensis]|uniref:Uncharacterized protein n=1 Tax=Burkholderia vietnamiensis (strain G4 / LMG 22486) TaxID=269482 RepID=A4JUB2_BURVG|nr:conserved hypothetical protein [Burkholderia vietnamiensis G4]MCB4349973.1 hypothetical protein [Burkholderia vietnamiensis]
MSATGKPVEHHVRNRRIRGVSERDIALALVLEYAELEIASFSLMGFYDNDFEFLEGLSTRLSVPNDAAFLNKLRKVVRRLVNYGVLCARMSATAKEYVDEPAKQTNYMMKPGKAALIRRGETAVTMAPQEEAAFLLRHAYPEPQASG